jgi:hypothetical protein
MENTSSIACSMGGARQSWVEAMHERVYLPALPRYQDAQIGNPEIGCGGPEITTRDCGVNVVKCASLVCARRRSSPKYV